MIRSLVLCALGSIAPLVGQASYVNYGQGCNAFGAPLVIGALGTPKIGTTVMIGVTAGTLPFRPGSYSMLGYLATGTSRTSYQGLPLPFRIPPYLTNYGGFDCDILCSVDWLQDRGLYTYVAINIPCDPRLIGLRLYQQWYFHVVVRVTPILVFWLVSNGGEMTIGG